MRRWERWQAGPGLSRLGRVWSQRSVVDYGLARRAALTALHGRGPAGTVTRDDVCDAHPYLLRAARFHGEPSDRVCPVCGRAGLTDVRYVYGEQLGGYEGRVKARSELAAMAREYGEFRVYVVEVCQGCAWNHLVQSYVLGDGVDRPQRTGRSRGTPAPTPATGSSGGAEG